MWRGFFSLFLPLKQTNKKSVPFWGFDGEISIIGNVSTPKMEGRRLLTSTGSPDSKGHQQEKQKSFGK